MIESEANRPWPNDVLIHSSVALVEYCKKQGHILVTSRNRSEAPTPTFVGTYVYDHPKSGQQQVVRLHAVNGRESLIRNDQYSPLPIVVHVPLCESLNNELRDETSDVRKISTWPITRCFVYVDVSDFSRQKAEHQAIIINSLIWIVDHDTYWKHAPGAAAQKDLEAKLCIGDGYIFVFKNPLLATYFAGYLAVLIEELVARRFIPVAFHFRSGVHVGPVYSFWDSGRNGWNYIGDGINGGNRVLAAIGTDVDDVVFISGDVRQTLIAANRGERFDRAILANLKNRGRRLDKHAKPWRVYELNHTDLCSLDVPGEIQLRTSEEASEA